MGKSPRGASDTSWQLPEQLAVAGCRPDSTRQHVVENRWATAAQHRRGTLPTGLMTLACPVPWAIINAGALVATVAVSFAPGAQTFNGAGARTASNDLIRASDGSEAALFEIANIETIVVTAQFGEATRAKLRNRFPQLMRKFKLIDHEFGT